MRFPSSLVRGLACAGLALAFLPAFAAAQEIKILFVGNSFTHGKFRPVLNYNAVPGGVTDVNFGLPPSDPRSEITFGEPGPYGGIPGIFKKFTVAAGLNYNVTLETCSGKGLSYHYANALPVIAQAQWNVVVLQDLSNGPIPPEHNGTPATFITAVNQLEAAIHGQNPAAQIYLFFNFSRADQTYTVNSTYYGQPIEAMGNDLINGYQAALDQNANLAGIIPAGAAWLRAIGPINAPGIALRNPYTQSGLDLWAVDHYHPSRYGCYLNALVIFGRVTGVSPNDAGLSTAFDTVGTELGIAPADALALRQVAAAQLGFNRPPPPPARSGFTTAQK